MRRIGLFCCAFGLLLGCSSAPGSEPTSGAQSPEPAASADTSNRELNISPRGDGARAQPAPIAWSTIAEAPKEIPDGYVHVPGGALMHSSCVHEIPNGSDLGADLIVHDRNGIAQDKFEACQYPVYRTGPNRAGGLSNTESQAPAPATNGWIVSTDQTVPAGATTWNFVQSQIVVPSTPKDTSAVLYYFSAVSPSNGTYQLLQPVLQWGVSPAGGGKYWAIASWEVFFAGSGVAAHTPLTTVSTGDVILAENALQSVTSGCFGEFTSTGIQEACGTNYQYYIGALDFKTGMYEAATINNVSTGPDAPPDGSLFPIASPAVFESHGDTTCENPVEFAGITLAANTTSNPTDQVYQTYNGTQGPLGSDNGCNDYATTTGTTTWLY